MAGAGACKMTIAGALTLPVLRRALPRVVSGDRQLQRSIRWVHAGEVPDIATLLHGGELLLTTGMGIGARRADQRRFVAELAAREVAGIAVELGDPFAGSLPPALVAAAEQRELPLIELHARVPFVAITEAIHTAIVNDQYELLRRTALLQDRFTDLMLRGGGIPAVLAALAEELANPVFLEDGDGRLLHWAAPSAATASDDALGAWAHAPAAAAFGAAAAIRSGGNRPGGRLVCLPVDEPLDPFAPLAVERARIKHAMIKLD